MAPCQSTANPGTSTARPRIVPTDASTVNASTRPARLLQRGVVLLRSACQPSCLVTSRTTWRRTFVTARLSRNADIGVRYRGHGGAPGRSGQHGGAAMPPTDDGGLAGSRRRLAVSRPHRVRDGRHEPVRDAAGARRGLCLRAMPCGPLTQPSQAMPHCGIPVPRRERLASASATHRRSICTET